MELQKYCDEVEKTWPFLVQIKQERKPIFAGSGLYTRLVVTYKLQPELQVTSPEYLTQDHLIYWMKGFLNGVGFMYKVAAQKSETEKAAIG